MAPFPESEDMTIKRLMVALRKNDYQLLKMGTYKLHEKFHTGHEFELTDELRQILATMKEKQYPPEISDILCSTIEDILSKKAVQAISKENQIMPADSGKTAMPQTLQAGEDIKELAGIINQNSTVSGIKTFEEIKPIQTTLKEVNQVQINNTPSIQPVQSVQAQQAYYGTQQNTPQNTYYSAPVQNTSAQPSSAGAAYQNTQTYSATQAQIQSQTQQAQQTPYQTRAQMQQAQQIQYQNQPQIQPQMQAAPAKEEEYSIKNIAVFYDDYKNDIDFADVKDYKNNLNFLFSKNQNGQDYNILKQISSLTQALDTNTNDVDKIISMLTTSKGKVSFITASQSQNISKIFYEKNIDFDIPFVKKAKNQNKDAAFDLIPMNGSTNIFVCSNCNMRTLKTDFNTRTLSVQCPHCEGAAFPDIYAINSYNPDCNPVFWHRAFAALVKSQIWILVNPPLDENKEIIFDFIKTAYDAGRPSKIYILSKENDKKEFYRQMFKSVNENCEIKFNFQDQDKLCEEFINEEIIRKVFA